MRLNLGIRRRLAPLLDNNPKKIKLAYNLLFSFPGSPFIYYGDEIGMGDDISLPDREGVRTPMQWDLSVNAGFSTFENLSTPVISDPEYSKTKVNVQNNLDDPSSIWRQLQNLIRIRKTEIVFDSNNIKLVKSNDEGVLAFTRKNGSEEILFIHNLCDKVVIFTHQFTQAGVKKVIDILSSETINTKEGTLQINLQPFQSMFIKKY
jgi:maltose alpha-D-glucosyltransferase/alpha-amylase